MMFDLVIIGGGPAGISSAIYGASRGLKTLVLEKKMIGGLIGSVSTVTHYSGIIEEETGESFAKRLKAQAESAGVSIVMEQVVDVELEGRVKKIHTEQNTYEAKAVIIANGTIKRMLGIPGETEFEGRGIGLNATRDAEKYRGKEIFVVGGADGAVKEALYLSQFASKLTIIHFEDQLGAIQEFQEKIKQSNNISVMLHTRLVAVEGNDCVDTLKIQDEHTKDVKVIKAKGCGVFIYAGSTPDTELYDFLDKKEGYLVTNEKMETKIQGVYAVGDICVKQVRQVATAVADGAIAGVNAANYSKNWK